MMKSESSNYKLGRLDKVHGLKFVLTRMDQPRYRVQDGLWPNHKKQTKLLNFGKALVEFPENLSKEGITFLFFDVFSCVLVINHF